MNEDGESEWDGNTDYISYQMQKISAFANGLNMPVIIGEYGAIDKDNLEDRYNYLETFNTIASSFNIITAYWDNGYDGPNGFALFDRTNNNVTDLGEILISVIIQI